MSKRNVSKRYFLVGFSILLVMLMMTPGWVMAVDEVNINTADKETLSSLPGIGPVIAERIIEYREKNESFKTKEDIMNIKGIGDKTFQKIKDFIVVE